MYITYVNGNFLSLQVGGQLLVDPKSSLIYTAGISGKLRAVICHQTSNTGIVSDCFTVGQAAVGAHSR